MPLIAAAGRRARLSYYVIYFLRVPVVYQPDSGSGGWRARPFPTPFCQRKMEKARTLKTGAGGGGQTGATRAGTRFVRQAVTDGRPFRAPLGGGETRQNALQVLMQG